MSFSDFSCRQNWSKECEDALNEQINLELEASMYYLSLSSYFGRDDIALEKLDKLYYKNCEEERTHAKMFIDYQNKRGGIVELKQINKPNIEFKNKNLLDVLESFKIVLNLEKKVNDSLLKLHEIADKNNDSQFCDYLEGNFLNEQVDAISEISKNITKLQQFGNNTHAIWAFLETF